MTTSSHSFGFRRISGAIQLSLIFAYAFFLTTTKECVAWSSSVTLVRSYMESCLSNSFIGHPKHDTDDTISGSSRRSFLFRSVGAVGIITSFTTSSCAATDESISSGSIVGNLPMVTVAEFETILKSSSKSIQGVELFSYSPTDQRAIVTLVDGTKFGLSNLMVESPTDPRSPLKLVSTLQRYNVPYKFPLIEEALSKYSQTKRKLYLNDAEKEALRKEEEKRERIAKDVEVGRMGVNGM